MENYNRYYVDRRRKLVGIREQLVQLLRITYDGDLISKNDRDLLVKSGLAVRIHGYNIISTEGIKYLSNEKIIHP